MELKLLFFYLHIWLDDGDDVSYNQNECYMTDELKNSIEIEDKRVYNISDKLYEIINCILAVFL